MANIIRIKRGAKANLPILSRGELGYATDTNELFIGVLAEPTQVSDNVLVSDLSALDDYFTKTEIEGLAGTGLVWDSQAKEFKIDFADGTQALDDTNETKVMNPKRTFEAIDSVIEAELQNDNLVSREDLEALAGFGLEYNEDNDELDVDTEEIFTDPTFTGLVSVPLPEDPNAATNKSYVDALAQGIKARTQALVLVEDNLAGTYNSAPELHELTASSNGAFPTTDGVDTALLNVVGARIVLAGQTNKEENGLYVVKEAGDSENPWVLRRCEQCDTSEKIPGSYVFITKGTKYENTGWLFDVADPTIFVLGTDDINVIQFSGVGVFVAGTGIDIDANIINAVIASREEAETGTETNKLMTPERTSQAIKTIAIDGGTWVTPVVDITNITPESVTFTIQNLEDFEVDVKYDLNTPPTVNLITLAANTTSSELTITGLDEGTNYILYAQSFLGNDAISAIISNPFTSLIPDDLFGAPGAQVFIASTTSTNTETDEEETSGFFGLVDQATFGTTMTQIMTDLGITQGTAQFTTDPLLKFLHRGKIKYINQRPIRHSISWNQIQARLVANGGNAYGGVPITIGGRNYKVRLMRGWGQVSANTDGTGAPNYNTGPLMTISLGAEYSFQLNFSERISGNKGVNWPNNNSPWNAASPNEWNTLMLPIHEDGYYNSESSTTFPNFGTGQKQTQNVPNWASYLNSDLQIGSGYGRGTWTQETINFDTFYKMWRGSSALTDFGYASSFPYDPPFGLRFLFELDETLGGVTNE